MHLIKRFLIGFTVASVYSQAFCQGTIADYKRAVSLDTLFRRKVYDSPTQIHSLKDEHKFWYLINKRSGKFFILIDADKKEKSPLFDHEKLAKILSEKLNKEISAGDLPFDDVDFDEQKNMVFRTDSAKWKLDLNNYDCTLLGVEKKNNGPMPYWGNFFDEKSNDPVLSPDSLKQAFIKNANVYIKELKSGNEYPVSYDGSPGEFYSSYVQWSPDGRKLMAYKVVPAEKRQIFFVESSPQDQLQPKLTFRDYLKPGDVVPQKKPQLFLVDEKKHIAIEDDLFRHQFDLNNIEWRKDSRAFTFEFNERGHQNYRVIEVDAASGKARVLVDERSNTFIDYSGKRFRFDVDDGKEIIWASERDGWNHLYLYDGLTGKVKNQITKGKWVVREVVHVDSTSRTITFAASGLDKGKDPYFIQYCRVNFDGSGFKRLTTENANHEAVFSSDFQYFIDKYSTVDTAPVTVLRSAEDGKVIMEIEEADIKELEATGWKAPEVFTALGRDGKTDIWGIILRPSNFDPAKKYPVIEYIYAGPQSSYVPKSFHSFFWNMQDLAELGFVVVQIDGMGTSNRSKAFHDVCWKNLKDAGFPDRIAWIKAAAKKYPYMDTSRVGIFGASAGGQNAAAALIFHNEFYKAAFAASGCHDNRMDKIWWNEQWMGYPIGPQYAASSNVVNASQLKGDLMLVMGEVDDNVDPATTMQFVNALVKANIEHELVILPGVGHTMGGEYGKRKRWDFFVSHLLNAEPPAWRFVYTDDAPGKAKIN